MPENSLDDSNDGGDNTQENTEQQSDLEEEEEDSDGSVYEVDDILDVDLGSKGMVYLIKWGRNQGETWEPEDCFIGTESKQMLRNFKAKNKEKIESLKNKTKRRRKQPSVVSVDEDEKNEKDNDEEDLSGDMAPRELTEEDSFYGKPVRDLRGESRRLFDPSHLQTATDLILSKLSTNTRISRSQVAGLKRASSEAGSGGELSRSQTPSSRTNVNELAKKEPAKRGRKANRKGQSKKQIVSDSEEDDEINDDDDDDVDDGGDDDEPFVVEVVRPKRGRPKRSETVEKPASQPKVGKRGRPAKKSAVVEADEDGEDEVPAKKTTLPNIPRKRVILDEDTISRDSESPGPSKPQFFVGRDDDEDQVLSTPPIVFNKEDPFDTCHSIVKDFQFNHSSVCDAMMEGDVRAVQVYIRNEPIKERFRETMNNYTHNNRPLLHSLIYAAKNSPSPHVAQRYVTMIRIALQFSRQFVFATTDPIQNKPIHEAVRTRQFQILRLLVNSGSLISHVNNNSQTPLEIAALNRDVRMFRFLLTRGATFHQLLSPKSPAIKTAFIQCPELGKELEACHSQLSKELRRARKRVFRESVDDGHPKIVEIQAVSPVMILARNDSNCIDHEFENNQRKLENKNQGYFLTIFPVAYNMHQKRWNVSYKNEAFNNINVNGKLARSAFVHNHLTSTILFANLLNGTNKIVANAHNSSWNRTYAFAMQIVRYEITQAAPTTQHKLLRPIYKKV
ncbi:unnamed protein product [Caenorhabditis bovis]|uniref:Chromo domain-containing protein n=1 Tax=Caenorhabditis bovis TaxID=2654633 RepID=A0A8S1EW27_9PELO|nr:unnamed protein product [Caenorhabditis bovis]